MRPSPRRYQNHAELATKLKVLVFAASLRAESLNRKLSVLAARVAEQNGAIVDLASMHDFDVSSYDGDVEAARGIRLGPTGSNGALWIATPSSSRPLRTTPLCRVS